MAILADKSTGRADLSSFQVVLFASSSGLSVANVYYAQPLLDALALSFSITPALVGGVIFATQVGCTLALLLLVPLGDVVNRRRLMRCQLAGLIMALLLVCTATHVMMLLVAMLLTGMMGTAMTQGMIAYAAAASTPEMRGRVVGAVAGGVVIGLLLARAAAGLISDITGWRGVYFCSALLMVLLAAILWRRLPDLAHTTAANKPEAIPSLWRMLNTNRVLQVRGVLALLMFASFNIFWSALVLLLRTPPWQLSHGQIGALGLVGAISALIAGRAGRWADSGLAERTSAMALAVLLLSWLPLWLGAGSLMLLIIGILLLDAAGQALHVSSQSLILASQQDAGGRLIAGYMLFYSAGSGAGALLSTQAFSRGGWDAVCLCGIASSVLALLFWMMMPLTRADG
ncbi:MFS transporter [Erwinia sorbitola]|uniref:MFS transporter n=1 Tax=Erwinia sorbitola TaxID=2681984 RepID=A0A6I6F7E1_9GAMM|nr:MFS transporter [Erwinia sorbitola]QGU89810.1 MFS transporter [Erwinia sorbitola]